MKRPLVIAITFSLLLNVYLIYDYALECSRKQAGERIRHAMGMNRSATKWTDGMKTLRARLQRDHKALAAKKYFYINIWINWCAPRIREMSWLDSLAQTQNRDDVGYIFLSGMSDSLATASLPQKGHPLKKFVYLNGMGDFVSATCKEQSKKPNLPDGAHRQRPRRGAALLGGRLSQQRRCCGFYRADQRSVKMTH